MAGKPKTPEKFARDFWGAIQIGQKEECWPWMKWRLPKGYGSTRYEGRTQLAHRIAYQLCIAPIPLGLHVLHRCDNPPCCNPAHLFVGTPQDNTDDMMTKGRHRSKPSLGSAHHKAKLTEKDVIDMRAMAANGDCTTQDLMEIYDVCRSTINRILGRRLWKHVS